MSKLFDMLKAAVPTEDIVISADEAEDYSITADMSYDYDKDFRIAKDGDIHPTGSLRADALRDDALRARELVREIGAQKEISSATLEHTSPELREALLDDAKQAALLALLENADLIGAVT